jgi:ABC-type transport system involved in cytochrome bd biosynthesis fused ATPase/permease subunit
LGISYHEKVATSEVVQLTIEGVEQLEAYFGRYLLHFFYSMISAIMLFAVFSFLSWKTGFILFCCPPLIPILIRVITS